jgi:outer membrane lipoprotein-sorting protein
MFKPNPQTRAVLCAATFAFAFLTPLLQADPLSPADVKALLARIREKRAAAPQVQADFQEEKTVHMLNKPITSSGKMWFQSPNKFRREAKGNSPSITVSDGQHLWIYYPKFKSAEHYTLGKRRERRGHLSYYGHERAGRLSPAIDAAQPVHEEAPAIVQHSHEQRFPGGSDGDAATERRPHHHDVRQRIALSDPRIHLRIHPAAWNRRDQSVGAVDQIGLAAAAGEHLSCFVVLTVSGCPTQNRIS